MPFGFKTLYISFKMSSLCSISTQSIPLNEKSTKSATLLSILCKFAASCTLKSTVGYCFLQASIMNERILFARDMTRTALIQFCNKLMIKNFLIIFCTNPCKMVVDHKYSLFKNIRLFGSYLFVIPHNISSLKKIIEKALILPWKDPWHCIWYH